MITALTKGGRSLKGAALYYLHDKRRDGEAERLTAERVAWTQTVNLPTDDPERAWRMMATTAMKADELKAGAGVKATGNKLQKPVFSYSLSWDPSERPTPAEQRQAAEETLKLMGFEDHQALIVSHNDEPHPHVHVIVNRVHPTEGRAHEPSYPKKLLSKWAQGYEEKRGKVFCPQRVINNEKRDKGEFVRHPRIERPAYEFAKAAAPSSARGAFVRTEQQQQDAQLSQAGRDMHDAHAKQWEALKRTYREAKDRLYARADKQKAERAAEVKQEFRPTWGELFRRQRDERRTFEARERSPFGKLWNIAQTVKGCANRRTAAGRPAWRGVRPLQQDGARNLSRRHAAGGAHGPGWPRLESHGTRARADPPADQGRGGCAARYLPETVRRAGGGAGPAAGGDADRLETPQRAAQGCLCGRADQGGQLEPARRAGARAGAGEGASHRPASRHRAAAGVERLTTDACRFTIRL